MEYEIGKALEELREGLRECIINQTVILRVLEKKDAKFFKETIEELQKQSK